MAIFKGSGVALVTPMKENGQINYDALEALIEDQLARSGGPDRGSAGELYRRFHYLRHNRRSADPGG